jgi:glycosyltransferase involved in cell wall biosynthesis
MTTPAVGLVAEQLFQRPSGGIGTYVRALLGALPAAGVAVRPVIARHADDEVASTGLDDPIRLSLPRTALYEAWGRLGRPTVPGELDLIHATSLAYPFAERRPVVVTVHDLLFRTFPDAYTARGVAFHERGVTHLGDVAAAVCPSEVTAEVVRALPNAPPIVAVTPLGCDLRPASPIDVDGALAALGIRRPYVLWMGSREPRKNLRGAIEAFALAARTGIDPGTTLVLAGPAGWGEDPTDALIRELGVADRVVAPGYVDGPAKAALLTGAAAFLFPSIGEGFGLPVLEAMACGAPVVASDRTAIPEVAGGAALLVAPEAERLAEALGRVLTDAALAQDLRERGRARAAGFTWERTARLTADVYRQVLAG